MQRPPPVNFSLRLWVQRSIRKTRISDAMTRIISQATLLDMVVKWEPMRSGQATFFSGIDNDTGTIRMVGQGIWRPADAQRYFDQQRWILEQARRRFGALKVFMDLRGWVVEDSSSVLQFDGINRELFRPEDRLAAIVGSSVDKKHSRDALAVGTREAFVSPNAAEIWLQAYSGG